MTHEKHEKIIRGFRSKKQLLWLVIIYSLTKAQRARRVEKSLGVLRAFVRKKEPFTNHNTMQTVNDYKNCFVSFRESFRAFRGKKTPTVSSYEIFLYFLRRLVK